MAVIGKGNKTVTQVGPTTAATQLLAANNARVVASLTNNGGQTVYLGKDNTVTTASGTPLAPGETWEDRESLDAWYGVVASGTGDMRLVEVA
jgi:hypothetical protein